MTGTVMADTVSKRLTAIGQHRIHAAIVWSLPVLLVLAGGCGRRVEDKWTRARPKVYPATGIVLYQGKPVEAATVMFESVNEGGKLTQGIVARGHTDKNGRFQLEAFKETKGAVPGRHRVLIRKVEYVENRPVGADPAIDYPKVATSLLPAKYGEFETSGLTATVAETGPNAFQFELQ